MCNVFIYNTYFLFHIIQINLARLYTQQQNVTNCFFFRLYYIIELVKEKKINNFILKRIYFYSGGGGQ